MALDPTAQLLDRPPNRVRKCGGEGWAASHNGYLIGGVEVAALTYPNDEITPRSK